MSSPTREGWLVTKVEYVAADKHYKVYVTKEKHSKVVRFPLKLNPSVGDVVTLQRV